MLKLSHLQEVEELHAQGKTDAQMQAALGLSYAQVRKRRAFLRLPANRPPRYICGHRERHSLAALLRRIHRREARLDRMVSYG